MREYIFRGKRIDNGEWVYGSYIDASRHWHNRGIHREWICLDACSNGGWFALGCKCPVVSSTVGQFTGLCDKNGEKIFEGDIVRCWDEHSGANWMAVVEFGNPNCTYSWGWQLRKIRGNEGNTDILLWVDMEETGAYIEVVGTIYDKEAK